MRREEKDRHLRGIVSEEGQGRVKSKQTHRNKVMKSQKKILDGGILGRYVQESQRFLVRKDRSEYKNFDMMYETSLKDYVQLRNLYKKYGSRREIKGRGKIRVLTDLESEGNQRVLIYQRLQKYSWSIIPVKRCGFINRGTGNNRTGINNIEIQLRQGDLNIKRFRYEKKRNSLGLEEAVKKRKRSIVR